MNFLKRWIIRKEVTGFVDKQIKESNMSAPMKAWLIGLANAAASGLAAGSGGMALGVDFKHSLGVAAISTLFSLVKWIAQHPIPGGAQ